MNTLTKNDIWNIFNSTPAKYLNQYADLLIELTVKHGINTTKRQAMFLAQIKHESSGMQRVTENLNYSRNGLLRTFGKYFNVSTASSYARNPMRIANRVYANRMGNGSESSGDGWKYRGRGLIQLTGKNNYKQFSEDTGLDAVGNPDIVATPEGAIMSAIWFWNKNNLNRSADDGDIRSNTRTINGGYNGLHEREQFYTQAIRILGKDNGIGEPVAPKQETTKTNDVLVQKGDKGDLVRVIQEKVKTDVDGDFGPKTLKAVKAWQKKNGFTANGKIDNEQLTKMGIDV